MVNPILRDLTNSNQTTVEKSDSYAEVVNNTNYRQNAIDYIRQMGGDPRRAFFAYAKEHNIVPEQAISLFAKNSGMNLNGLLNMIMRR